MCRAETFLTRCARIACGAILSCPRFLLLATLYLMINTVVATPGRALAGLGIIALGFPVYAYHIRRLPADRRIALIESAE